jgi:hypothetical protein
MTSPCHCEQCPHKITVFTSSKINFPTVNGGQIVVGPLAPGESDSFEKDGHYYIVERAEPN